ncbi:MAG TPA: hypothetical protein VLA09_03150 [Longimicrobiales bacterium]|nr:hypothetical protein [Longimicrobiales bacterium]
MSKNETMDIHAESGSVEDDHFEATSGRFRAIEREVRKLRLQCRMLSIGMVGAIALAGISWIVAAAQLFDSGAAEVLEARRIVLQGPDGDPRGEWSVDEEGNASLSMLDRQARERISVSVLGEGYPGLALSNAAGERRVALGLLPDETTSLVFADGSGVPRAVLGLVRGDAASLLLADAEGVSRIGFGLNGEGFGSVILPDGSPGTE